jgi:type IV pilus assembly protein PilW
VAGNARQQGLGLVEIMVALAIGVLIMDGVYQIYFTSKQSYRTNEALSRVQENGRFAMDFVSRDMRLGGFNPVTEACGGLPALTTNTTDVDADDGSGNLRLVVANPGSYAGTFNEILGKTAVTVLGGYESYADGDWDSAPEVNGSDVVVTGTDVLVLGRFSSGADTFVIKTHPDDGTGEGRGALGLDNVAGIEEDDILMAFNEECSFGVVFKVTAVDDTATPPTVSHAGTDSDGDPSADARNRTEALGQSLVGGTVIRGGDAGFQNIVYYIALNDSGQSALFRRIGTAASEELVEGVENMQIIYGEDTDGDGGADTYRNADNVADMGDVLAVRVSLLVASPEANVLPEAQSLTYNGASVDGSDRRLRQVFTTTIGMRSRL